jgi:hypothetical protein
MPVITFDDFAGGLDVRGAAALSKPNILQVLTNAYVTNGKAIRKRPCLSFVATIEPGTVGLKAGRGKLNTFYGQGSVVHANTLFTANKVEHPTLLQGVTKVHFADQYNGYIYVSVEYQDSTVKHHYLDTNPVTVVADANCPHTKQVAKQAQKIFARGATDPSTVRYCKTGDPRDWSAASDAGFLPAGLYAKGSDEVTAIGPFQRSGLWIAFGDNSQVWTVDPDPENNVLLDSIEGIGTIYHRAAGSVSRDLFFYAQSGFRSVSLVSITNNLQDNDVGSAIDKLVRAQISASDDPLSLYYPKLGQFWSINGSTVWAYTFSRTSKVSAWSKFTLPFTVDDATVLNQELYVRTGDDVYVVSDSVYKDGSISIPLVDVQMYYQDGKRPGVLKQFMGMDMIGTGQWTVSHLFAADNEALESQAYELPAITEPNSLHPVELMATRIAPHFQHQKDEAAEINAAMLHYENLGAV